jgi:hypothetical protein
MAGRFVVMGGSVTFEKCTFRGNWAYEGGAIDGYESDLTLTDCTLRDNEVRGDWLWGGRGGGLYWQQGGACLTRCQFALNRALAGSVPDGPVPGQGGAIFYREGQRLELRECIFTANSADAGAAISVDRSNLSLVNCLATGNLNSLSAGTVEVCNMEQIIPPKGPAAPKWNVTMTNSTFAGNRAPAGRALACDSWEHNAPSIVHITNCILWDGGDEIRNNDKSVVVVSHSDLTKTWAGDENIDRDPLFVASGLWDPNGTPSDPNDDAWVDGDYHLIAGSRCLDRGANSAVDGTADLDGNPRIVNEIVDMGAYERQIQGVIYVDDDAAGANNGSSWVDAYRYLQDALAAARLTDKPVEIHVAQGRPGRCGRYRPLQALHETQGRIQAER